MRGWLVICLGLLGHVCNAQDDYVHPLGHYNNSRPIYKRANDSATRKLYFISINAGISQPLRDYGGQDTMHNFIISPFLSKGDSVHAKGFAEFGYHINLTGGYFLSHNFGLVGRIGFDKNDFDQAGFQALMSTYPNNLQYLTYTFEGDYTVWQYMGGVFCNFPLSNYSSFTLKGMLGLITANYPVSTISYYGDYVIATLGTGTGFAYSLNGGVEDMISNTIGFVINFSYSACNLSYPGIDYKINGFGVSFTSYHQSTPVTMKYGSLDFTAGFNLHL